MTCASPTDAIELVRAIGRLNGGSAIAFPTEEGYVVAVDAEEVRAVQRLRDQLALSALQPFEVLLARSDAWERSTLELPSEARRLAECFSPGAIKLCVQPSNLLATTLAGEAASPTLAFWQPAHPIAAAVLQHFGRTLAAMRVDAFHPAEASPTRVRLSMAHPPDVVLADASPRAPVAATVVTFRDGRAMLVREGAVAREALETAMGRRIRDAAAAGGEHAR